MTVLEFAETIIRMEDRLNCLETEKIKQNVLQWKYDQLQKLCRKHSEDMMGCVRMCIHRPNVEDALKTQGAFYEAIKQLDDKF
jgi:hypothetical protein